MKSNSLRVASLATLMVCGTLTSSLPLAAAPVILWSGNGHMYEVVVPPSPVTWPAANSAAIAMGGHLATITSAEENAFLFSLVANPSHWLNQGGIQLSGPWLGGFRTTPGNWNWVTSEPFVYSNWELNQPDNQSGQETVLQFFAYGLVPDSTWNDSPNTAAIGRAFIVEYVPEPSSAALLGAGIVLSAMIRSRRAPERR